LVFFQKREKKKEREKHEFQRGREPGTGKPGVEGGFLRESPKSKQKRKRGHLARWQKEGKKEWELISGGNTPHGGVPYSKKWPRMPKEKKSLRGLVGERGTQGVGGKER